MDASLVTLTKYGSINHLSQEAILAHNCGISYHPFEGTANDVSERQRLVNSLGTTNRILLLQNQGPSVAGTTLEQAFAGMYFVTRASTYQINALASVGGDILHMSTTKQVELFKNAPKPFMILLKRELNTILIK